MTLVATVFLNYETGGLMKARVRKLYRDSATPKNKFYHFNVLGFKFRIKTKKGNYKWIEWKVSRGIDNTYISIGNDIS